MKISKEFLEKLLKDHNFLNLETLQISESFSGYEKLTNLNVEVCSELWHLYLSGKCFLPKFWRVLNFKSRSQFSYAFKKMFGTTLTSKERYDFYREEINEVVRKSCIEKFGVDNYNKIPGVAKTHQEKIKKTNLERYGVDQWFKRGQIKLQAMQSKNSKTVERFHKFQKILENNDKTEILKFLFENYSNGWAYRKANALGLLEPTKSKFTYPELLIKNFLENHSIEFLHHYRPKWLNRKELDFFIPNKSIAIEVNGLNWHNSSRKSETYHKEKFLTCHKNGINLISFRSDEIFKNFDFVKTVLEFHILGNPVNFSEEIKKSANYGFLTNFETDFLDENLILEKQSLGNFEFFDCGKLL